MHLKTTTVVFRYTCQKCNSTHTHTKQQKKSEVGDIPQYLLDKLAKIRTQCMKEQQLLAGQRGGKVKAEAGTKRSKGKCMLTSSTETQKTQQSFDVFLPFSCFTILNVCPVGKSEKRPMLECLFYFFS